MRMHAFVPVIALVALASCADQGRAGSQSDGKVTLVSPRERPAAPVAAAPDSAPGSAVPAVPEGAGQGDSALAWSVPRGWVTETPASTPLFVT